MKMRLFFLGLLILLFPLTALAQSQHADYSAKLNASALQPGQTAVLALVLDIKPGLHAQSHEPIALPGQNAIKFDVQATANDAIEFLPPIYPKPKVEFYPALGKESVYTGRVIIYIPMRVKSGAPLGPIDVGGKFTFQACDEKTCFMPDMNKKFSVTTQIIPATQTVTPQNAELFSNFDQSIFSKGAVAVPVAAADELFEFDFLGHKFSLHKSQYVLALLVAFAIGIIYNLVPCVLPVVPLKAIGFFEVSRHSRGKCFFLGCVFSLGVVSVFAVLALLLIPLRHTINYSWGEQFKYGWFVWSLVAVLVAMALGMFGLFDVLLPSSINNLTPNHETIVGNFLFGMLTAILSTPCTAPMFVTALAWAVAQPTALGIAIIVTMGCGMAFPYLVLSAFPSLASRVPRTGPWSAVLKQMMGFLVLAVAVYFAVGRFPSRDLLYWSVFIVIVGSMIFLIVRTFELSRRAKPIIASLITASLVIVASIYVIHGLLGVLQWQPYSPQALEKARSEHKLVLVEFTANWCGNCIYVEGHVYHDPKTLTAIREKNVTLLRADLTSENAEGWKMVNELNPAGGIPLTAVYGPAAPEPIKLTSIYTSDTLLNALGKAER